MIVEGGESYTKPVRVSVTIRDAETGVVMFESAAERTLQPGDEYTGRWSYPTDGIRPVAS